MQVLRRPFVLLLLLVCGFSLLCSKQQTRLNLVLIGIDTLRRDHLGCYGYDRQTSPNIDKLASEGVLFENVVSQAPWTLPSFASIFTSLYPSQHGAGFIEPGAGSFGHRMRSGFPTLGLMLLKQGYSTAAIINAPALAPEFGVDRGFEYYLTTPRWDRRTADETTEDALRWIGRHNSEPFLMFVHYFDPHVTYEPPAPYDTLFDPDYTGPLGNSFDRDTYFQKQKWLSNLDDPEVRKAWDHIRALYDGEIAFTDKAVGDLLDGLEKLGLRNNTLIVLISDHGEEFFDHKGFEHGHTLYEELIKVPLIISLPGKLPAGKRIRQQVRSIDVLPTMLDIMGISTSAHLEGTSLYPLMKGKELANSGEVLLPSGFGYSESMLYGSEKKAVTAYSWKLIFDTVSQDEMLFNLAHDPHEHENLIETDSQTASLLEQVLFETMFTMSETWHVEIAPGSEGNTFDITLSLPMRPTSGTFKIWRVFDGEGHLVKPKDMEAGGISVRQEQGGSEVNLEMEASTLRRRLQLLVQVAPERIPCTFEISVDGKKDVNLIYLGEELQHPTAIPFTFKMRKRGITRGEPRVRPHEPYVLVWHTGTEYGLHEPAKISDDTKRKLKALGYIQ